MKAYTFYLWTMVCEDGCHFHSTKLTMNISAHKVERKMWSNVLFQWIQIGGSLGTKLQNYTLLYAYLPFCWPSAILICNKYCCISPHCYMTPDKELPTLYPNIGTLVLRVWSGLNILQWQKNTRWIWKRTAWNISTVCTWGKLNYEKSGHCDHNAKIKLRNHWRPTHGHSSILSISLQTCISRWKTFSSM